MKRAVSRADKSDWACKIIEKAKLDAEDEAALKVEVEILQKVCMSVAEIDMFCPCHSSGDASITRSWLDACEPSASIWMCSFLCVQHVIECRSLHVISLLCHLLDLASLGLTCGFQVEHPAIVKLRQIFDCPKTFYMVRMVDGNTPPS